MATIVTAIPRPKAKRRPRNQPVAGRATLPDTYFVKRIDNSRLRREVDGEKRRECYGLLGLGTVGSGTVGRTPPITQAAFAARALKRSKLTAMVERMRELARIMTSRSWWSVDAGQKRLAP